MADLGADPACPGSAAEIQQTRRGTQLGTLVSASHQKLLNLTPWGQVTQRRLSGSLCRVVETP